MQNSFQKLSNMFIFAPCRIYLHQYPYGQYSYIKETVAFVWCKPILRVISFLLLKWKFYCFLITFQRFRRIHFVTFYQCSGKHCFRETQVIFFILSIQFWPVNSKILCSTSPACCCSHKDIDKPDK